MTNRGHKVDLFTWDENESAQTFFPLHPAIKWHKLSMGDPSIKAGLFLRAKRFFKIRQILKALKPDVVLAFQEGAYYTISFCGKGLNIPMICAIRESPFRYKYIQSNPSFEKTCQIFRHSAAVTLQFERYKNAYPDYLQSKLRVIGNHIFPAEQFADTAGADVKHILSAGRLSPEKNHAALIDAFALISEDYPDWRLTIIGKGNEEENLKEKIKNLPHQVSQRIMLAGPQKNVPEWLLKSQIYCQPSKWEGFPNSVAEAMAHKLPVVGFDACDGVCDLIEDRKTGLLAEGMDGAATLSQALRTLMGSPELREQLGTNAYEYTKKFLPSHIYDQWEHLFKDVSHQ